MGKVVVKNKTNVTVKIEEGNAGVFHNITILKAGGEFTLKLDPNATYREYVLIKLPDQKNLDPPFSSDDLVGLRKILITEEKIGAADPTYSWQGIDIGQKSKELLNLGLEASSLESGDGKKDGDLGGTGVESGEQGGASGEKDGDLGGKGVDRREQGGASGEKASVPEVRTGWIMRKLKNIFSS